MRAKSNSRFDALKEKALSESADSESTKTIKRPSVLAKRQNAVVAAATGKSRTVKVFEHDPNRIRPWAGHNRDYAALSKERCSDLIEGFRRIDQQFPAIVRVVRDSPDYDYEFICGARRHWTANYLNRDLLVEIRNVDDRDAFLLQDIENRDREDISDYERACDYAKALPVYFEGKQSHMAEQLQIDSGNFNRLLALVELPKEIISAYSDIRELVVHHGTLYTKFLKDPDAKRRILTAAKKLEGQGATGKQVMSTLRQAAGNSPPRRNIKPSKHGSLMLKPGRGGEFTVSFKLPAGNRREHLLAIQRDFQSVVDSLDTEEASSRSKSAVTE